MPSLSIGASEFGAAFGDGFPGPVYAIDAGGYYLSLIAPQA